MSGPNYIGRWDKYKKNEKLRNEGIGIQNKIIQMLNHMPTGTFNFEVAIILRNACLILSEV